MKLSVKFFLVLLAIASFIGFLSPVYWLFDLFNHFRIHALLASVVLCAAAYILDKKLVVLAVIILLGNGGLIGMRLFETGGIPQITSSTPPATQINIVSANVYTANNQYQNTLDTITRENPDIIVFTETNELWIQNLSPLESTYVHTLKHPRPDNFGMAIYSKLPFQAKILSVGGYELPLAVLDFTQFKLIVAHPIPPVSENNMRENKLYLETIAQQSANDNKPIIIAGDLNSTLWGDALTPLLDANLKRINPSGIAYTWPTHMPQFAMQIDHFFAKNILAANFKVLGNIGSDHYPIQATIALPEKQH